MFFYTAQCPYKFMNAHRPTCGPCQAESVSGLKAEEQRARSRL